MVEKWKNSTMALNIKDSETEELVAEIASQTGESKTGAVRQALRERRDRLALQSRHGRKNPQSLRRWLETEIWPQVPDELLDQKPISKAEREDILGYGEDGV